MEVPATNHFDLTPENCNLPGEMTDSQLSSQPVTHLRSFDFNTEELQVTRRHDGFPPPSQPATQPPFDFNTEDCKFPADLLDSHLPSQPATRPPFDFNTEEL